MTNLHQTITKFLSLKNAEITFGPKHPENPRPELAELLTWFLKEYPYLTDPTYQEFLSVYGGAGIFFEEEISYGLDFLSIYEIEGPLTDDQVTEEFVDECYFPFAEVTLITHKKRAVSIVYAFKNDGRLGVYRKLYREKADQKDSFEEAPFEWVYANFLAFLEDVVEKKGIMIELK